ncbi:MAG TPA: hypothetical protein VNM43_03045 [Dehalococcoidia bacterium]|nr:hypothetical protein [Dehalococcoidia bacterium]
MVVSRLVESGESPLAKYERIAEEDAARPRFTGQIGDFLVLPLTNGELPKEARILSCGDMGSTPVPADANLRNHELWSPAFEGIGIGWSCPGQGVVAVNNETEEAYKEQEVTGDGSQLIRGYIRAVPVLVARDAPRDRLELVTVEGHPGLLEHPVPDLPFGLASLVVIERYPEGDRPGILVAVYSAPSAEAAIEHAEEIMP